MTNAILLLLITLLPLNIVKAESNKTVSLSLSEDTYIEEGYPEISPWNNRNLYLGYDQWYSKMRTRILIKPNLSPIIDLEIKSEDIIKASLVLSSYTSQNINSSLSIKSTPINDYWSMYSVNWNNKPRTTNISDISNINTNSGSHTIDITNSFKSLILESNKNGLSLSLSQENNPAIIFWATECLSAPSSPICNSIDSTPNIEVTYLDNSLPSICEVDTPISNISTNSSNISIRAKQSIDPDNDDIKYLGRVCNNILCEEILWEDEISSQQNTEIELGEGEYFIQCSANDYHSINQWGKQNTFQIDQSIPETPEIITEPEYISSFENNIFWLQGNEANLEYQVLASERSTFSAYNTYSEWVLYPPITFQHSKEKTYYYKIRVRDSAGNISDWSEPINTTIDLTIPQIKYFKSSREILSPKIIKDGKVEESAYIQGGIDDKNLSELEIRAYDKQNKLIYKISENEKSYLRIHWPDKLGYPDGQYYLILRAIDGIGNIVESDPLIIQIDKTPPAKAKYIGIKNHGQYKSLPLKFSVKCPTGSLGKVKYGNKIIKDNSSNYNITLTPADGDKSIITECTDIAGNSSQNKIEFTIDTKPPAKPSLTLSYSEKNKQLIGSVYCRENGTARFFINGVDKGSITCNQKKYAKLVLWSSPSMPGEYIAQVRVSDSIGNWSEIAEKSKYLQSKKPNKTLDLDISCSVIYNATNQKIVSNNCEYPKNAIIKYINTKKQKDSYSSIFEVFKLKETKIFLTIKKCKPKTLFDFRTWFSCHEEIVKSVEIKGTTSPLFKYKYGIYNKSEKEFVIEHSKTEKLFVSQQFITTFSYNYSGKTISGTKFSDQSDFSFNIEIPKKENQAIFKWIFNSSENVSQWYGYTKFQSPHKGIDFSVYHKKIIVPSDGIIVAARYDKTNDCFAGGYYIAIKHKNGLYSYYFHIKELKDGKKNSIKVGQTVKKGMVLATTGNSGKYNCQPLAYHLHFEIRTSRNNTDHINPVPYIKVNWNKIKTAKADIYPNRLSGKNPHPNF